MIEQHAVGQRVLVDLVPERAEQEEPENRQQDFGGEEPDRQVVARPARNTAAATMAQPITNRDPSSILTMAGSGGRTWGSVTYHPGAIDRTEALRRLNLRHAPLCGCCSPARPAGRTRGRRRFRPFARRRDGLDHFVDDLSGTTTSISIFGRRLTLYSLPR